MSNLLFLFSVVVVLLTQGKIYDVMSALQQAPGRTNTPQIQQYTKEQGLIWKAYRRQHQHDCPVQYLSLVEKYSEANRARVLRVVGNRTKVKVRTGKGA